MTTTPFLISRDDIDDEFLTLWAGDNDGSPDCLAEGIREDGIVLGVTAEKCETDSYTITENTTFCESFLDFLCQSDIDDVRYFRIISYDSKQEFMLDSLTYAHCDSSESSSESSESSSQNSKQIFEQHHVPYVGLKNPFL